MSEEKRSCICPRLVVPSGDSFVVRAPSPAGLDFQIGAFPTAGAWTEKDLSAIVPAGAVAALIWQQCGGPGLGDYAAFRKAGNTNAINRMATSVYKLGIASYMWMGTVAVDGGRKIEYYRDAAINRWDVVIFGWWI